MAAAPPAPAPAGSATASPGGLASVVALTHAVVSIRAVALSAEGRSPTGVPGRAPPRTQPCRGFVIDAHGYILTNDRVVRDVGAVEVTLHDGRTLPATVVARDALSDIAVLKVEATGLPTIPLGSSRALVIGEPVLSVGVRGDGADGAMTTATIRATGAATGGNVAVDLPSRPEASGGPLLNRLGQAVGILVSSLTPAGDGRALTFAVPIDRVKPLLGELTAARGPASRAPTGAPLIPFRR